VNETFPSPADAAWSDLPSRAAASTDLLIVLREDQESRWVGGIPVPVEAYVTHVRGLSDEDVLALLMGEVDLRRRRGEDPTAAEYQSRFPALAAEIAVRFELAGWTLPAAIPSFVTHTDAGRTVPGATDTAEASAGQLVIPGYAVGVEIGRGGMGVVLSARDLALDRQVAVKILRPGRPVTEAARRFLRESKITAGLTHPGVPPVYAVGSLPDGSPFLAMKLIAGRTLADLLRDRLAADLPRFVQVFEQVAQAVAFAHSRGVIHRDLKPANVMVGAFGEVQVMDWGLARSESGDDAAGEAVTAEDESATAAGAVMGTPAYMAPEQARGELVNPRADVFALGGILCEILTGHPPFAGDGARAVLARAAAGDVAEALARLEARGADTELVALAGRCLSPKAEDRPADGKAVADAVAAYHAGVEERLRAAERERAAADARAAEEANTRREAEGREKEQRKRRRGQLWLGAAVLLLAVGAAAFAWWQKQKSRQVRENVPQLVALATDLRDQGRYRAARKALDRAAEALDGGDAPELVPEIERAKSDLAFFEELDDIRSRSLTHDPKTPNKTTTPVRYRAAFLTRGLDFAAAPPDDLAARVADSAIRPQLIEALDVWAVYEPDPEAAGKLLGVLRRVDRGPWLDRLRDPAVRADKERTEALIRDTELSAAPVASLGVLARLAK